MSVALSQTDADVGAEQVESVLEEEEEKEEVKGPPGGQRNSLSAFRKTRTVSQHFRTPRSSRYFTYNSSNSSNSSSGVTGSGNESRSSSTTGRDYDRSDRRRKSSNAESLNFLLPARTRKKQNGNRTRTTATTQMEEKRQDTTWVATPQHGAAAASRMRTNTISKEESSETSSTSSSRSSSSSNVSPRGPARGSAAYTRDRRGYGSRSRGGQDDSEGSDSRFRQAGRGRASANERRSTREKGQEKVLTAEEEGRLFGNHLRVLCLNCYLIPPSISWNPHLWAAFWSCKRPHQRAAEIGQVAAQYDLVCLQEVWGTNMPALTAAVLPTHSILPETQAWGGVAAAAAAPRRAIGVSEEETGDGAMRRQQSSASSFSSASAADAATRRRVQGPVAPARGGNAVWRCAASAAALFRWWGSELLDPWRFYCSRTGGLFYAWRRQKCSFLRLERQPFPRKAQIPFSNQNVTAVELDIGGVFPPYCRLLLLNTHFSVLSKDARDISRQALQQFVKVLAWKSYLRFLARKLEGEGRDTFSYEGGRKRRELNSDDDASDTESSSSSSRSSSSTEGDSDSETNDNDGSDNDTTHTNSKGSDTSSDISTNSEGTSSSGEGDSSNVSSSTSSSQEAELKETKRRRQRRARKGRRHRRKGQRKDTKRGGRTKKKNKPAPSFLKGVAVLLCGDFNIDAKKTPTAYQKLKSLDGAARVRDLFLPLDNPNYSCQYTYFTQEMGTSVAEGANSNDRKTNKDTKGRQTIKARNTMGNTLFPWPTAGRIDYMFAIDDIFLTPADVRKFAEEYPPDAVLGEEYEEMDIPVLRDGSVRIFFEHIHCLGMDIVAQEPGKELSDHWPLSARITIGKPPSQERLKQMPKPRREQLLRGYSFCCSTAYSGSRRRNVSVSSRPAAGGLATKRTSSKSLGSKGVTAADTARRRQQSTQGRKQRQQYEGDQGKKRAQQKEQQEEKEDAKTRYRQLGVDEAEVEEK